MRTGADGPPPLLLCAQNVLLSNNYHSNGASPNPDFPSSAILAIAAVGLTVEGAVCSQYADAPPQQTQLYNFRLQLYS